MNEAIKSKVEDYLDALEHAASLSKDRNLQLGEETIRTAANFAVYNAGGTSYGHTRSNGRGLAKNEQGDRGQQAEVGEATDGGSQDLTGVIEKKAKEVKQGTGKNGKKWKFTKYSFLIDGKWYNTIDANVLKGKVFNEGDTVDFTVGVNDAGYACLESICAADGALDAPDDDSIPF